MIPPSRITLFLNRASRSGRGRRNWPLFLEQGFRAQYSDDGTDFPARVAADDGDVAVAVGGDGTINLVINGIMNAPRPKALGVLYAGTSPDFCLYHGIPVEPEESLRTLMEGHTAQIDLGEVTTDGFRGWFASSCNIGLGAPVAACSNALRRYLGDTMGTLAAALRAILVTPRFDLEIAVDGENPVAFKQVRNLTILKNPLIASGLRLDLPVEPDDGLMHAVVIPSLDLHALAGLYRGRLPAGATVLTGRRFSIRTDRPVPVEYDGDPQPAHTPVEIACRQRILNLVR